MKKYISLLALCSLIFVSSQAQDKDNVYGDNLVTISPLMVYASPQVSDVGVGLGYERFLNNYISIKVPVNLGLTNSLVQTGLGLKFFPTGHRGVVRYSVTPTLLFSQSTKQDELTTYDPVNMFWYTQQVENKVKQLGFSLVNSLNVTIQKNIYMAVEMGLGLNYLNDLEYLNANNNGFQYKEEDPNILFQFGVSLGYRF